MTAYASTDDLASYAEALGMLVPAANADELLDAASRDLDLLLVGTGALDTTVLSVDQLAALARGTCAQALYRDAQGPEQTLGEDDGVASAGGLTFSVRTPARVSPLAVEEVSGYGLLKRSGCAPPPPDNDPECPPGP